MAENYVLLESINLTQTASSITFDNLPTSGYTDLKVVASVRGNRAGDGDYIYLSLNGANADSGKYMKGTTSGTVLDNYLAIPSAGSSSNAFGNIEINVPNFLSTTAKNTFADVVVGDFVTASGAESLGSASWTSGSASTSAVTNITLTCRFSSFIAGSTFSLYGLAATGTTNTFGPFASGGNIVANDGTYWYHAFLNSGTFTPLKALTCDYLVVAGGGGGGWAHAAGGGAGGLRSATAQSLISATAYPVTIGAGGITGTGYGSTSKGTNGTDSTFNSMTSTGGGAGGGSANGAWNSGNSGGSGGGGSYTVASQGLIGAGNTPSTSPSQGNNGGTGSTSPASGGGGGGAGAVGTSGSPGAGGIGSSAFSDWGIATTTGQLVSTTRYFAGGGGGGVENATGAAGGSGGGGAGVGSTGATGGAGIANTGGGGGGGGYSTHPGGPGGSGGSGIVIVRYLMV